VDVVGERAHEAVGPAALHQRGGEVVVAREIVGDTDRVRPRPRDLGALRHQAVAHRAEVRVRQLAGERGLVRAVARRVDGEKDAGEAAADGHGANR
jgi:hypothetical protein